jgi:hypothetical protein
MMGDFQTPGGQDLKKIAASSRPAGAKNLEFVSQMKTRDEKWSGIADFVRC